MRVEDYRRLQANSMSEAQFQSHVIAIASRLGWLVYHTHDSRRSEPGFPDLVLVRGRTLFRELKTGSGVLSKAQHVWLDRLEQGGSDAGVWRPDDLMSGLIERELRK